MKKSENQLAMSIQIIEESVYKTENTAEAAVLATSADIPNIVNEFEEKVGSIITTNMIPKGVAIYVNKNDIEIIGKKKKN